MFANMGCIKVNAGRIYVLALYVSTVCLSGCYGTVAPQSEDARYSLSDPSEEDLIHITPGTVPVVAVGGIIQIVNPVDEGSAESYIETEDSGSHLDSLSASLREALLRNSGIETQAIERSALPFFGLRKSNEINGENSNPDDEQIRELPDELPAVELRNHLLERGFTHLVLLHVHVGKDPVDSGVLAGGGGVGLVTSRLYSFNVGARVYPLDTGLVATKLQLNDSGYSAAVWTVLIIPAALKAVSVNRYMEAMGTRLGEEIAKRWTVASQEGTEQ